MKIFNNISDSPKTPYAPKWNFSIGSEILPINLEKLSKTCLEKEKEILKTPVEYFTDLNGNKKLFDGFTGLGKNSTTSRSPSTSVFGWDTPEINSLKKNIRRCVIDYNRKLKNTIPEQLWVHCWVNVLRFGQKIKPHLHAVRGYSYLSAHFTVQCNNTSTCFINPVNVFNDPEIIERKNEAGKLTIFPSYLPHYTTRHYSFKPRITLAMDITCVDNQVLDYPEGFWILL